MTGPGRDAPGPLHLGVLVSGTGTTLLAIEEACRQGRLPARIALVTSDREECPALRAAEERGLAVERLPRPKSLPPGRWEEALDAALQRHRVELVVLAGFLRILPASFLVAWSGRVINLHPSLLPKFGGPGMYGPRVYEAVIASGDRETGATVHLVTAEVDRGPVLQQRRWPVQPGESAEELAKRQKPMEHALIVDVIGSFAARPRPPPS